MSGWATESTGSSTMLADAEIVPKLWLLAPHASPMRRLLVDMYVAQSSSTLQKLLEGQDLPEEFLVAAWEKAAGLADGEREVYGPCEYHQHDASHLVCGETEQSVLDEVPLEDLGLRRPVSAIDQADANNSFGDHQYNAAHQSCGEGSESILEELALKDLALGRPLSDIDQPDPNNSFEN